MLSECCGCYGCCVGVERVLWLLCGCYGCCADVVGVVGVLRGCCGGVV